MNIIINASENEKYLVGIKVDKKIIIYTYNRIDSCQGVLEYYLKSTDFNVSYVIIRGWKRSDIERIIKSFLEVK